MEYWPLCAIIPTNDRKEKSLAGVTAPWTRGCRADCEEIHRTVVCPCCAEERAPTSCPSARCTCARLRVIGGGGEGRGGVFNDQSVMEGGPLLGSGVLFLHEQKKKKKKGSAG